LDPTFKLFKIFFFSFAWFQLTVVFSVQLNYEEQSNKSKESLPFLHSNMRAFGQAASSSAEM
jgi:hypothetical protein